MSLLNRVLGGAVPLRLYTGTATDRCLRLFGNRIIAFPFVLLHRRGVDDPVSRRRPSRRCVAILPNWEL